MISTDDGPGALRLGTAGLVPLVLTKNKQWWSPGGLLAVAMRLESELGLSWSSGLRQLQLSPALQLRALVQGWAWAPCSMALQHPCPHGLPARLA